MQRAKPHVLEAVQYVEESRLEPVSCRATRSVSKAASLPWWLQRHNKRAHAPDAFTSSSFHVQFKLWKACALEILGKRECGFRDWLRRARLQCLLILAVSFATALP